MRWILLIALASFALASCGKKAPLRPPEEPEEQSLQR